MKDGHIKRIAACFVCTLICVSTLLVSFAMQAQASETKSKKAVIICVDGLSAQEFFTAESKMPNLQRLVASGGISLMNTNTAGGKVPESTYLTINAGAKAMGIELLSGAAYNGDENIMDYTVKAFAKAKGLSFRDNQLLYPVLPGTVVLNKSKDYGAQPGLLGDVLKSGQVKTYVFGNADVDNLHKRFGVSMLMDGNGIVDGGIVNKTILRNDIRYPAGVRSDYNLMFKKLLNIQASKQNAVILFDLGDLQRLSYLSGYYSDPQTVVVRNVIFKDMDEFIGHVTASARGNNDLLLFVSPTSSVKDISVGGSLTVLCASGNGIVPKTILTSGSTRRQGIVVNTDIAPTLTHYFGLNRGEFSGNRVHAIAQTFKGNQEKFISQLDKQTYIISTSRVIIVTAFIVLQLIALLLAFAIIIIKGKTLRKVANLSRFLLLWVAVFPAAMLLAPLLSVYLIATPSYFMTGSSIFAISLALAALLWFTCYRTPILPYCVAAILTLLIIFIDNAYGGPLAVFSTLSFDPIIGARFYGIGNEFEGIVCGAFIVMYASLFELLPNYRKILKIIGAPLILLVAFIMTAPWLGADVGGTIVSFLGLGYVYLLFLKEKVNWKMLLILFGLLTVAVFGAVIFDLSRPIEQQTHLARLVHSIGIGGFTPLLEIVTRKIAMNLKLITITKWSLVLLTSLIGLFVLYFRPVGLLRQVMTKYPYLRKGFIGSVVAAVIEFLVNDSGVVAAGTLNIFPVMLLVSLMLLEQMANENVKLTGKEEQILEKT